MAIPSTPPGPDHWPDPVIAEPAPARRRWSDLAKAGLACGVLAGTAAIASNSLPDWEVNVFEFLHDVPRWVDYALWVPMQFGTAWAPLLAAGVAWYAFRTWRPVVGSLVAGWGGWWLAKGVKDLVDRGRPAAELDYVRPPAVTDGLGFVSGHTTVAFACAAALSPYLSRRWRIAAYGLASVVGTARVVVGAHFPLDVIGGAALGLGLAYLWHFAVGVGPLPADRVA